MCYNICPMFNQCWFISSVWRRRLIFPSNAKIMNSSNLIIILLNYLQYKYSVINMDFRLFTFWNILRFLLFSKWFDLHLNYHLWSFVNFQSYCDVYLIYTINAEKHWFYKLCDCLYIRCQSQSCQCV